MRTFILISHVREGVLLSITNFKEKVGVSSNVEVSKQFLLPFGSFCVEPKFRKLILCIHLLPEAASASVTVKMSKYIDVLLCMK